MLPTPQTANAAVPARTAALCVNSSRINSDASLSRFSAIKQQHS